MLRKARLVYPPWSVAGGPDAWASASECCTHCRALTAADLVDSYRRRFPNVEYPGYDAVIRRMGHVWDCPSDGAVNVVGYLCAHCGCPQPGRLAQVRSRAYVRHLCSAFGGGGV